MTVCEGKLQCCQESARGVVLHGGQLHPDRPRALLFLAVTCCVGGGAGEPRAEQLGRFMGPSLNLAPLSSWSQGTKRTLLHNQGQILLEDLTVFSHKPRGILDAVSVSLRGPTMYPCLAQAASTWMDALRDPPYSTVGRVLFRAWIRGLPGSTCAPSDILVLSGAWQEPGAAGCL